jgi:succinylglutamate desuccinylase
MTEIQSKALNSTLSIERIIDRIDVQLPGPTMVFFGGIHGNEPSGIFALKQVMDEIREQNIPVKGTIIAIAGNLWALERGERFHERDLNRLWSEENVTALENGTFQPSNEDEKQQLDIFQTFENIIETEGGPFYFFDLHTTSGDTGPFITVNDSIINRKFTENYPVPLILGIEEHLTGPLLSYVNELGYVSFGFEGGQHDSIDAIDNHKIFTYLSLVFGGVIDRNDIAYSEYMNHWKKMNAEHQGFYEIYDRYAIQPDEQFTMEPGFTNFDKIQKGQLLASSNNQPIKSEENTTLFMPLYQAKGEDGYFLIKRTPRFFLWLSGVLRRFKIDRIFPLLPGVKWTSPEKDTMTVDLRIARFITKNSSISSVIGASKRVKII